MLQKYVYFLINIMSSLFYFKCSTHFTFKTILNGYRIGSIKGY